MEYYASGIYEDDILSTVVHETVIVGHINRSGHLLTATFTVTCRFLVCVPLLNLALIYLFCVCQCTMLYSSTGLSKYVVAGEGERH